MLSPRFCTLPKWPAPLSTFHGPFSSALFLCAPEALFAAHLQLIGVDLQRLYGLRLISIQKQMDSDPLQQCTEEFKFTRVAVLLPYFVGQQL